MKINEFQWNAKTSVKSLCSHGLTRHGMQLRGVQEQDDEAAPRAPCLRVEPTALAESTTESAATAAHEVHDLAHLNDFYSCLLYSINMR